MCLSVGLHASLCCRQAMLRCPCFRLDIPECSLMRRMLCLPAQLPCASECCLAGLKACHMCTFATRVLLLCPAFQAAVHDCSTELAGSRVCSEQPPGSFCLIAGCAETGDQGRAAA